MIFLCCVWWDYSYLACPQHEDHTDSNINAPSMYPNSSESWGQEDRLTNTNWTYIETNVIPDLNITNGCIHLDPFHKPITRPILLFMCHIFIHKIFATTMCRQLPWLKSGPIPSAFHVPSHCQSKGNINSACATLQGKRTCSRKAGYDTTFHSLNYVRYLFSTIH